MKIAATREEIRVILSNHFRMDITDFSIIPATPSYIGNLCRNVVCEPGNRMNLIRNVKALRELGISMFGDTSLMDAKWAIENWVKFIAFVDEYNRFPVSGYGAKLSGTGVLV